MATTRRQAYAALMARLRADCTLVHAGSFYEDVVSTDQVPATKQPALVLRVTTQDRQREPNQPALLRLRCIVTLLVRSGPGTDSDQTLNDLVDQVERALRAHPGETPGSRWKDTTLGGLVQRAHIHDEIEFGQGEQTQQAGAYVPIEMVIIDQQ